MTKPSNDRLPDLDLFPTDTMPKDRREAMGRVLQERRATIGRAVSCGAVTALAAVFCLFYGAVSVFAWTDPANPTFGVMFSIFSGGLLIASVHLAGKFREELRQVVVVPERLRREVEAETALEQGMLDINLRAIFWNDAARLARATGVSEAGLNDLLTQRAAILRRRLEIDGLLKHFKLVTSPKPHDVRPSDDWGPVEEVDLTDTDS